VLGTTEKENVEDETDAEWVGGFGEPDWDNQPPRFRLGRRESSA
jgi:hypothetical protein